jgi:hypothetical protein
MPPLPDLEKLHPERCMDLFSQNPPRMLRPVLKQNRPFGETKGRTKKPQPFGRGFWISARAVSSTDNDPA